MHHLIMSNGEIFSMCNNSKLKEFKAIITNKNEL